MNEQPDQDTIVYQWIKKAENDLINAKHTLLIEEQCPYDTICFHAQQSVEKYTKALLLYHKINFPKSHDLNELLGLLPLEHKTPLTPDEQSKLSDYAIASRYPVDDMDDLTRADAEEAIRLAKKVREYVRHYLSIK